MTVYTRPTAHLVAAMRLNMDGVASFLANEFANGAMPATLGTVDELWERDGTEPEMLCELMGRLCYGSFGELQGRRSTSEYLSNVMAGGHGSVIEHATFSIVFARCSRSFTHQTVRHRVGVAYSQESTHFKKYTAGAKVTVAGLEEGTEAYKWACSSMEESLKAYETLWDLIEKDAKAANNRAKKKVVASATRAVLPNGLTAMLGVTGNARFWRWFIELRGADDNSPETRMAVVEALGLLLPEAPTLLTGFEVYVAEDGFEAVRQTEYRKV